MLEVGHVVLEISVVRSHPETIVSFDRVMEKERCDATSRPAFSPPSLFAIKVMKGSFVSYDLPSFATSNNQTSTKPNPHGMHL